MKCEVTKQNRAKLKVAKLLHLHSFLSLHPILSSFAALVHKNKIRMENVSLLSPTFSANYIHFVPRFVSWGEVREKNHKSHKLHYHSFLCYVYALLHPHLEREFYNLCNRFTFIEKKHTECISISSSALRLNLVADCSHTSCICREKCTIYLLYALATLQLDYFPHHAMHHFPSLLSLLPLLPSYHLSTIQQVLNSHHKQSLYFFFFDNFHLVLMKLIVDCSHPQ